MSAPDLLVVIDPAARLTDGESVRIAKDVLCAGAPGAKVCRPEHPDDVERALARRGSRRPVLVGDDRALLRTVRLLHRERELADCALAVVPVGPPGAVSLARSLGVPVSAVEASRAVLSGTDRPLDLLVDDSGGVVLGALSLPAVQGQRGERDPACAPRPGASGMPGAPRGADGAAVRGCRSLVRTLARPLPLLGSLAGLSSPAGPETGRGGAGAGAAAPQRLRVEADGSLLADLDRPVQKVWLVPDGGGLAEVVVQRGAETSVRARAHAVTVSGPDFRYRADALVSGPVRARTWTALGAAWHLTLPC